MDISKIKTEFQSALGRRDKTRCAKLIIEVLEREYIDIVQLYEDVLAPSLDSIASNEKEQEIEIWDEHMRSNVVRMAIELCYPYIVRRETVKRESPRAMVFCIEDEFHELGARMTTDFLTLLGYDSYFIGANTPVEEALNAIGELKPDLVCISVSNFYSLIKIQDVIEELRRNIESQELKPFSILLGGYAVANTPGAKEKLKPDYFATSYRDLEKIKEGLI